MLRMCYRALVMVIVPATVALGQSNIDPSHTFAWGENIGWADWRAERPDPNDGVIVQDTFLGGFVWGENIGWINVGDGSPADGVHYANTDASDFGVNLDAGSRELSGLAWGENVGWINFAAGAQATPPNPARLDTANCRFSGFAWGENIGWISFDGVENYVAPLGWFCTLPLGDMNCDGVVDFGDINPFVQYLADFNGWQATYPNCPPENGDINGDGSYPSFGDINPFVALMTGS